jgi:hypothetical protein
MGMCWVGAKVGRGAAIAPQLAETLERTERRRRDSQQTVVALDGMKSGKSMLSTYLQSITVTGLSARFSREDYACSTCCLRQQPLAQPGLSYGASTARRGSGARPPSSAASSPGPP